MKKNIWIINFTALAPSLGGLSRHYFIKKELNKSNKYNCRIITNSVVYNSNINLFLPSDKGFYKTQIIDDVEFTIIKGKFFKNLFQRVLSIYKFTSLVKKIIKHNPFEKPDILYVSISPEMLLGSKILKLAKKLHIPCLLEIRDIYPDTLNAVGKIKSSNFIYKLLVLYQKRMYEKANALITTFSGCKQYIIDKHWDVESGGKINLSKCFVLPNGINLEEFDSNNKLFCSNHVDNSFKITYAGTIGKTDRIDLLLKIAQLVKNPIIQFNIYGKGPMLDYYKTYAQEHNIKNVCFMNFVDEKYIANILTNSNLNIYVVNEYPLYKYGLSMNKVARYLASGKPILAIGTSGYSVVKEYDCGYELSTSNIEDAAKIVDRLANNIDHDYIEKSKNARLCAANVFDIKAVVSQFKKIMDIIFADIKG